VKLGEERSNPSRTTSSNNVVAHTCGVLQPLGAVPGERLERVRLAADPLGDKPILIRADGAGFTHTLISAISAQGMDFSVGFPVTEAVRTAIAALPPWAWQVACNAEGDLREHADIAEIIGLLDLSRWAGSCRACW